MQDIELRNITKRYGSTPVIRNVSLKINAGEFAVLVGPSGSGKSTLLRMIAGLEEISDGTCSIGGKVVNRLPPKRKRTALYSRVQTTSAPSEPLRSLRTGHMTSSTDSV